MKLRLIVLTHGGAELVLREILALENLEIAGVFIETATTPQRPFKEKIKRSIRYDGYFETLKKFAKPFLPNATSTGNTDENSEAIWQKTQEIAEANSIKVYFVKNYHDDETIELLKKADADLGIIYGTNIIKEKVFALPKKGSINLHQADARIYRGGPPVFWELFNDEKEVGLTVHFVAAKVDTGDIILQKSFPLNYDFAKYGLDYESFINDFRAGLKLPCAEIVAGAVKLIRDGEVKAIKQDTSKGTRYRLPLKGEKDAMLRRLRERMKAKK